MAKRTNPYTEDYVPQSKVHIGVKQFNNNEDRLQKVYEKTLELLFKGANKQLVSPNPDSLSSPIVGKDKLKQLFIGKDGTLLHTGTIIATTEPTPNCYCGDAFDSHCSYCEKTLCVTHKHWCKNCYKFYCLHCGVMGCEGEELCISCYS